jgi:hypothetical protein
VNLILEDFAGRRAWSRRRQHLCAYLERHVGCVVSGYQGLRLGWSAIPASGIAVLLNPAALLGQAETGLRRFL